MPGDALKNRLFFFVAQEWVNYKAGRPTPRPCRPRRCGAATSASCSTRTISFSAARARSSLTRPTGGAFPGNIIPASLLSPTGLALLSAYPLPTEGFPLGDRTTRSLSERESTGPAEGQRPHRFAAERTRTSSPTATANTTGPLWTPSAAPSRTPALTGIVRIPRRRQAGPAPLPTKADQRVPSFTNSLDEVFINVFQGTDAFKRRKTASTIRTFTPRTRKSPTRSRRSPWRTSRDRRRSVSVVIARPDLHLERLDDLPEGSSYVQGRDHLRVPGEDDFDQINVQPIPAAPTTRTAASSSPTRRRVPTAPASASPTRRWACSPTTRRSASAP